MAEKINLTELPRVSQYALDVLIDQSVPPLFWELNVPTSIDAERIEVDLSRVHRLHRVGAFNTSIVTEYQGERSEFTPGVSGINMDGSAIAAKAGVTKKAERSDNSVIPDYTVPTELRDVIGRATVVHKINKAELAQNTAQKRLESHCEVSREEAWASELDKALRESYRNAGKIHLTGYEPRLLRYYDFVCTTAVGAFYTPFSPIRFMDYPFALPGAYLAFQTLQTGRNALLAKKVTGSNLLDQKRWSMFHGHQSDRNLVLNGLTRAQSLISVRK